VAFKHPPHYNVRSRPNKLAKGMTQTAYGCGHVGKTSPDANKLGVYGTCDALARGINWRTERTGETCSCCGNRLHTKRLSKYGRIRLNSLRRRRGDKLKALAKGELI
jgi:hypothetical protein